MTPELTYLLYATLLLLATILFQGFFSVAPRGILWGMGSRDVPRAPSAFGGRLDRVLRNYLETFPAFAALVLLLHLTGAGTETSNLAAAVWFWSRVAFIPVALSGVFGIRTVVWFIGCVALIVMAYPLVVLAMGA